MNLSSSSPTKCYIVCVCVGGGGSDIGLCIILLICFININLPNNFRHHKVKVNESNTKVNYQEIWHREIEDKQSKTRFQNRFQILQNQESENDTQIDELWERVRETNSKSSEKVLRYKRQVLGTGLHQEQGY